MGQLSAQALIKDGHQVILHARSEARAQEAMQKKPGAQSVLIADLADLEAVKRLADEANARGVIFRFEVFLPGAHRNIPAPVSARWR